MLVFPQLSSGAASQLPLKRETAYRTLVNQMPDGNEIRVADPDYYERSWEMTFEGLTDAEWQALEDLFKASEGRLKSFLFLEPGENLVSWSEGFSEDVWAKNGVTVSDGADDPFGGNAATEITGAGTVKQELAGPAWFRYAASIWAKTTETGASLRLSDGAGIEESVDFDSSGQWRRYTLGTAWSTVSEIVSLIVSAPGGGPVDVYGAQIEAQPLASGYKKTLQRGGVHPGARFSSDTLEDRATGVNQHSGVIRISWTPSQT